MNHPHGIFETTLDADTDAGDEQVRLYLSRRTPRGKELNSLACAGVARNRAERFAAKGRPLLAMTFRYHANRHELRARVLGQGEAA